MSRISSVGEFSPTGTVVSGAQTFSNAIKTEAARDMRVFVNVAELTAANTLDIYILASHDNSEFARVKAFDEISAAGVYVLAIDDKELGKYTKLEYAITGGGSATLGSKGEKKSGL